MTLLTRLRHAAGPSRELDAEIYGLMNPHLTRTDTPHLYNKAEFHEPGATGYCLARHYTLSMDAAAELLPSVADWSVGWLATTSAGLGIKHGIAVINGGFLKGGRAEYGANPAIALCIAALLARGIE